MPGRAVKSKPGDPLTDRQQMVLNYMRAHQRLHGHPPTLRAIADALSIASTNAVLCHLKALQAKGHIRKSRGDGTGPTAGHYVPIVPKGCCSACGQRISAS